MGGQRKSRKRRKTSGNIEVDLTGDTNPIVSIDAIAGKFIAGIHVHYIFQGVDGYSLDL